MEVSNVAQPIVHSVAKQKVILLAKMVKEKQLNMLQMSAKEQIGMEVRNVA